MNVPPTSTVRDLLSIPAPSSDTGDTAGFERSLAQAREQDRPVERADDGARPDTEPRDRAEVESPNEAAEARPERADHGRGRGPREDGETEQAESVDSSRGGLHAAAIALARRATPTPHATEVTGGSGPAGEAATGEIDLTTGLQTATEAADTTSVAGADDPTGAEVLVDLAASVGDDPSAAEAPVTTTTAKPDGVVVTEDVAGEMPAPTTPLSTASDTTAVGATGEGTTQATTAVTTPSAVADGDGGAGTQPGADLGTSDVPPPPAALDADAEQPAPNTVPTTVTDVPDVVTPVQVAPVAPTGSASVPASSLATTIAARVEEAVEALRLQPPPREATIEVEGMRLAVRMRGALVHVTADQAMPPGWQRELGQTLGLRGLELADAASQGAASDGGQRGEGQGEDGEPAAQSRPTPRPRADRDRDRDDVLL